MSKLSRNDLPDENRLEVTFDKFSKRLCKAKISFWGKNLGGLMMFKKTESGIWKVSFFNEIGMHFFDMKMVPDTVNNKFIVSFPSIYEYMDRENLKQMLEKDFNMLFAPGFSTESAVVFTDKNNEYTIFKLNSYAGSDLYYRSNSSGKIERIINISNGLQKKKVVIDLIYNNHEDPEIIQIVHPGARYRMRLDFKF